MDTIERYFQELHQTLDKIPHQAIQEVIDLLHQARLEGRTIYIVGNGGSASTASHFVCDLAKNTRLENLPNFRVIGLADNMAIFSALANDEGYENVFAGQLASLVQPDDIVIGISTSGNSANVVAGTQLAKEFGARTIGFTGFDGGILAGLVDLNLHVQSERIEYVEDLHLMLEHLICRALREDYRAEIFNPVGSRPAVSRQN